MALSDNTDSNFSNALGFLEEDVEIKGLLKWWAKKIFKWLTLWILENRGQKKRRSAKIREIAEVFDSCIIDENGTAIQALDVSEKIEEVVISIKDILNKNEDLTLKGISKISDVIRLKAFIFWVLKLLHGCWYEVTSKKNRLIDVPSEYSRVFYDVLKDKPLATLLVVLQSYELATESENPINGHEIEEEVKVLNIDKKTTIERLEAMNAAKVFEGSIHDMYYDYPKPHETLEKKGWIKSRFRIRKKTDKDGNVKYFYTIKRRLTTEEEEWYISKWILKEQTWTKTKRAFEKEFEIVDIALFEKVIKWYGLVQTRDKKKERVSYSLLNGGIKFDFDDYNWKQSMMEIEASKYEYVDEYIWKLGLSGNKTSTTWSQKFLADESTDKIKN